MQTSQQLLDHLWSEESYMSLATRLEKAVLDQTKPTLPPIPLSGYTASEHRIEDLVRRISTDLQEGAIHVGLTSSDIEDNVRLLQLSHTIELIQEYLIELMLEFGGFIHEHEKTLVVGRTHLIPAQYTTVGYRFAPTLEALIETFMDTPRVVLKGIGGVVGTRSVLSELGATVTAPWELDEQITCSQTSNMLTEYRFVSWVALLGSILSKASMDFRFMYGLGQIVSSYKDVGSSALASKKPNPFRFERVCGNARELTGFVSVVGQDIANNMLERTLDNQTNLHEILPRAAKLLLGIIDDFSKSLNRLEVVPARIKQENNESNGLMASEAMQIALYRTGRFSRGEVQRLVGEYYNGSHAKLTAEIKAICKRAEKQPPLLGEANSRLQLLYNLLFSVLPHRHPKWRSTVNL